MGLGGGTDFMSGKTQGPNGSLYLPPGLQRMQTKEIGSTIEPLHRYFPLVNNLECAELQGLEEDGRGVSQQPPLTRAG